MRSSPRSRSIAHWYARYGGGSQAYQLMSEARILAEFERVRTAEPGYGWSLMMEALFEIVRLEAHRWPEAPKGDHGAAKRAHYQKVRKGYQRALELVGSALRAGIPEHLALRSMALIQAYGLAFEQRAIDKLGEGAEGDAAAPSRAAAERFAKATLDLACQLLRTDPEDGIAHIARAAATKHDPSPVGRASFAQSVAVLRTLRSRLDAFLQRLDETGACPPRGSEPHDLEMAVFHHLLF
jgi:hypothetical protein